MIQGILVGVVAGLGIYSAYSAISGRIVGKVTPKHENTHEQLTLPEDETTQALTPSIPVETPLEAISDTSLPIDENEIVHEEAADVAQMQETAAPEDTGEQTATDEAREDKQWWVIVSKRGHLKLTLASRRTPKAVAGPFDAKEDAQNAKAAYAAQSEEDCDSMVMN